MRSTIGRFINRRLQSVVRLAVLSVAQECGLITSMGIQCHLPAGKIDAIRFLSSGPNFHWSLVVAGARLPSCLRLE